MEEQQQQQQVAQQQEVASTETAQEAQDFGSNEARASEVPPAGDPADAPGLTPAFDARIGEVTAQAAAAEKGLSGVVGQLPEAMGATALAAVGSSGQLRQMISVDRANLADMSAAEAGALIAQVEVDLGDLCDTTMWLDAWRTLGQFTAQYRVEATVAQGLLLAGVASGIGPELRRVADLAGRAEALRARCLATVQAFAKECVDTALTAALENAVTALATASVPLGPAAPVAVELLAGQLADAGKTALLDAVFGADAPETMVEGALSSAEGMSAMAQDADEVGAVLTGFDKLGADELLGPVDGALDALGAASGAADLAAEATSQLAELASVLIEVRGAKAELEAATAQLAPLLELAKSGVADRLAVLALQIDDAVQLIEDTRLDVGDYEG
ncbi:MAG: hypothetical protein ABMA64_09740 [Myxococcota bacterium]